MAYSSGFSPHPRISYANAAPTGAASEAEYLEIGLVERRDPDQIRRALDDALPPGLDVLEVVEAGGGALADRLTGSLWTVDWPGADADLLAAGVATLLAEPEHVVERMTKNGLRAFDVRGALVEADVDGDGLRLGASAWRTAGQAGRRAAGSQSAGARCRRPRRCGGHPASAGAPRRRHR